MRKVLAQLFACALLAGAASAAEMTGWISDASCGASNASSKAASRECAELCIKDGAEAVFVSEADQKVYKISDQAAAKQHLKGKVKVTGTVQGDKVTVTKIESIKG